MRRYQHRNTIIIQQPEITDEEVVNRQKSVKLSEDNYKLTRNTFYLNIFTLVINVLLVIGAFGAIYYSAKQTTASIRSVELADSIFRETKKYNEVTIAQQKENSDSVAKENMRQFKLQSESVNAQISVINQTQKMFEIKNEPYLSLRSFAVSMQNDSSEVNIVYDLTNLGEHPVRIFKVRGRYLFYENSTDEKTTNDELVKKLLTAHFVPQSIYVSKELPRVSYFPFYPTILERKSIYRNEYDTYFYFVAEFYYANLSNGKNRIYRIIVRTKNVNSNMYQLVLSENINI